MAEEGIQAAALETLESKNDFNLSFLENFVESIAQILSKGLSDKETERIISSWTSFKQRLQELSFENLVKLQQDSHAARPYCKHPGTCTENALRGFIKSFCVTFVIKYGLGVLPALLTGRLWKNPRLLLKMGGKDTFQLALFLSSFTTAFKATLCGLRGWRRVNDAKNAFVAGMAAGLTLVLDRNHSRRIMIALYLTTRSAHFVSRWLWRHYLEPQWDPHARTREALAKEQELLGSNESLGNGKLVRDLGRLRSPMDTPLTTSALDSNSEEDVSDILVSPLGVTKSALPSPVSPSLKQLELHPLKAARLDAIRKFIRQSAAVMVMMVSSSQILYSYVCEPDTIAKSYLSFLIVHGGIKHRQPQHALHFLNTMGNTIKASCALDSSKYMAAPLDKDTPLAFTENLPQGYPVKDLSRYADWLCQSRNEFVMCSVQHNFTTRCLKGMWVAFKDEWWRALSLYAPLNTMMAVLFRGKKIMSRPKSSLKHIFKSILRSTLFLTCYVTASWCSPCLFRNLIGRDQKWMYYVNGLLAGSMVLLEAPGRRLELALYCLPRAVESLWNTGVKYKYLRHVPGGEVIYFCISMGIIMTLYQHDPESIQDGYRKIMVRFLGVN